MRRIELSVITAMVLAACQGPSSPPARSSPVLTTAPSAVAADAIWLDVRDGDPLWAASDASGNVRYEDRHGLVAAPIPGHERDVPRGVRGLPGADVWVCVDAGVAHFTAGAWTFTGWSALGATNTPSSCDALDARAPNRRVAHGQQPALPLRRRALGVS